MTRSRRFAAEAVGTAFLVTAVVGSGIMAAKLAGGNVAIALLANTMATAAALVVLITCFGPISGAHFNPAVTVAMAATRQLPGSDAVGYVICQVAGGVLGTLAAHAMFGLNLLQRSLTERSGGAQFLSEAIATFGLLLVIWTCVRRRPNAIAWAVALYIASAYWFTASTSFANPAVTVARTMTETFTGIRPVDAPAFIAAQFAGAGVATAFARWLSPD